MQVYGLTETHLAQGFYQTLTGSAHSWFIGLEKHMMAHWKSIVKEFMKHYKSNEELKITQKHIEMTKLRDTESVNDFTTRWRELASQMIDRVPKEE